jgi:hypothetical protein
MKMMNDECIHKSELDVVLDAMKEVRVVKA